MNEIRFNSFDPTPSAEGGKTKQVNNSSSLLSMLKRIFKIFLVLILVALVSFVGFEMYKRYIPKSPVNDSYSAVFLSNGQVYFGKIEDNNNQEIILNNVFYLQSGSAGPVGESIQGSQFTLIKLGNELHGPTDELFINKQNVLFYEYLRDDSQVVQSIKNYKD